jgi:hypothetical protein
MAGKINRQVHLIITEVSKNNPIIMNATRSKLILKGIDPNIYSLDSPDDPEILEKLKNIAAEFGVKLAI